MKTTKNIIKLANGKFVKDWEYSQGHFDLVETDDALEACELDEENFMVFFMDKGATRVTAKITVDIVPMPGAALEVLKMKMVCARQKQAEEGKVLGINNSIYKYL
jgi:hypothetical protein